MDDISRPRKFGGWGLLDMRSFGNALLCKSLLRGIFGEGPWSLFINRKYLKGRSIEYWYRRNSLGIKRESAIWHSLRKIQSFFMGNLRWRVFSGSSILIGFDSIMNGLASPLPHALVSFFHSRGIFTWDKLIKSWSLTSPVWKDEVDLLMPPSIFSIWSSVRHVLQGLAIRRTGTKDVLAWNLPRSPLPVRVKDLYVALSSGSAITGQLIFPPSLWKVSCPLKMILFTWLLFRNRNLSWEVLQKKGWQGPGRCIMCLNAVETNYHMFFQCPASRLIWYELSISLGFPHLFVSSVQDDFKWWSDQIAPWRSLFTLVCWSLWKWRNESIFQNSRRPLSSLLLGIKANHDIFG